MIDIATATRDELIAEIPNVSWYHAIDLGGGLVTPGTFDIRPHLAGYGFPADMTGLKVLDVGPASGFFSFEFERRGATVTALELRSPLDKDWVGGPLTVEHRLARNGGRYLFDERVVGQRLDFPVAAKLLNSKVRRVFAKIYDVDQALPGERFDLVFCGSILNHVANPMAALAAVRRVADRIIVANPFEPDVDQTIPNARLIGRQGRGLSSWWLPTIACMEEMLHAAAFTGVEVTARHLALTEANGNPVPHFVITGLAEHSFEAWNKLTEAAPVYSLRPAPPPPPPVAPAKAPPPLSRRIIRKVRLVLGA